MTNQKAFTLMVQHLRTQGEPSRDDSGNLCLYRHKDGVKRCAVGVLIPDSEYHPKYEGNVVGFLHDNFKIPSLQGLNLDLLENMQNAHDDIEHRKEWRTWMEVVYVRIAKDFGLEVPPHPCATTQDTPNELPTYTLNTTMQSV